MVKALASKSAKGKLEPFEFSLGDLKSKDVEIAVEYCGLCHSDLSMLDNEWGMSRYPFVPGHEVIGKISALGSGVKGVTIGDRVGLGWSSASCMVCDQCMSGDQCVKWADGPACGL